ncbi:ATP-grasp domain-containing protein [Psychrobacillus sp. FSL H8-0484]|uniref:ATP-grasp domain-containing protein n=1 Tax=Psychrobacillus sp. FSL H8-0484 TaxID=2921390 RepID=UPI0030F82E3F
MNILILSCGTRNKIVQYFKKELEGIGKVYATDCSPLAPALYDADQYFIVPRIDHQDYLSTILAICKNNDVKAVFTLIDPEISLLAKHREEFLNVGTIPIVSDLEIVEMCFDKFSLNTFLVINGFHSIKSYIDKEEFYRNVDAGVVDFPVFVKPVKGSASIHINKVTSKEEVELLFKNYKNMMIQEFIDGVEIGADVYIDLHSGEPVAIFTKEKLAMRAGETDKSISIKDEKLFDLIKDFVKVVGFRGIIDIDIFKVNGEYIISEVNPRFGGGYPHAYESGVNIPKMIVHNLHNQVNKNVIGRYEERIRMMKYNEIKIIR